MFVLRQPRVKAVQEYYNERGRTGRPCAEHLSVITIAVEESEESSSCRGMSYKP
jgi:hypothetical protein